jgi:hypothetical protein
MIKVDATVFSQRYKEDIAVYAVYATDGTESHRRVVPVRTGSTFVAELLGMEYALATVNVSTVGNTTMMLKVATKAAASVLARDEDGSWRKTFSDNADIVSRIRAHAERFSGVECVMDRDKDLIEMTKERLALIE